MYRVLLFYDRVCIDIHETRRFRVRCTVFRTLVAITPTSRPRAADGGTVVKHWQSTYHTIRVRNEL